MSKTPRQNRDFTATTHFRTGWHSTNLFKDKEIHHAIALVFLIPITNTIAYHFPIPSISRGLHYALVHFLILGMGSLYYTGILEKKHFKLVLLLFCYAFIWGSLTIFLPAPSFTALLLLLFPWFLLLQQKPDEMAAIGFSRKNAVLYALLGAGFGLLMGLYGYLVFLLSSRFTIHPISATQLYSIFLSSIIHGFTTQTIAFAFFFNLMVKKGLNYWKTTAMLVIVSSAYIATSPFYSITPAILLGFIAYLSLYLSICTCIFFYTRSVIPLVGCLALSRITLFLFGVIPLL